MLRSLGPALEHLKPHLSLTAFTAGQVIAHAGDNIENIYFPISGLCSARSVLQGGQEIECTLIGKTNVVGGLAALGFDHMPARFVCLTDGHAWKIPTPHLVSAVRTASTVERQIKLFSFAQMGYAVHVGVCNAMHSAEQRLARWLTTATDLLGHCEVRLPQEALASGLGLQRSAVNPVLQKLKSEGLVDVARGRIRVIDPDRLSRRACECRLTLRRALVLDDTLRGTEAMGSLDAPQRQAARENGRDYHHPLTHLP